MKIYWYFVRVSILLQYGLLLATVHHQLSYTCNMSDVRQYEYYWTRLCILLYNFVPGTSFVK